jgi:hypothetical protein
MAGSWWTDDRPLWRRIVGWTRGRLRRGGHTSGELLVIRPSRLARVGADAIGLFVVGSTLLTVALQGTGGLGGAIVIPGVAIALMALHRRRVVVFADELVVSPPSPARRRPRDEIERFAVSRLPLGGACIDAVLRTGAVVPLPGTATVFGRRQCLALAVRLNGWVSTGTLGPRVKGQEVPDSDAGAGDYEHHDGLDPQGRLWRAAHRSGKRMEAAYPVRLPRWNWLIAWANVHPLAGPALQGAVFGLLMLPFLATFVLNGLSFPLVLGLDAAAAVLFAILVGAYSRYVSRHGEPWA